MKEVPHMCVRNGSTDDRESGSAAIVALRVLVVLFALCGLALQIGALVAGGAVSVDYIHADAMHWLYVIGFVLMVACFEAALAPLWRLLTLARRRDVFSGKAVRLVDGILGCAGAEGVLVILAMLSQAWLSPSLFLSKLLGLEMDLVRFAVVGGGLVALLLIAAFMLLMLVMRSLLRQAIEQRDELSAVI